MVEIVSLAVITTSVVVMLLMVRGALVIAAGIRATRRNPPPEPASWPFVSLIIPCKGAETGLAEHLAAHLEHDYPAYQVIFTVADEADLAVAVIRELMASHPNIPTQLVIAPRLPNCVEKTSNQIAALAAVDPRAEVLAFADSDGQPLNRGWLKELVRPVLQGNVATGFRWYLPRDAVGRLHGTWDSAWCGYHIAFHTVWGGAMALRRDLFERLAIADHWSRAVTDDLVVAREAWKAGVPVAFAAGAMSISTPHRRLWNFLMWARRQTLLVRLTTPGFYRAGLGVGLLHLLAYAACITTLILPGEWLGLTLPLAGLGAILGATALRTWVRHILGKALLPGREADLDATWSAANFLFVPLADLLQFPLFISVLWQRAIRWRGVTYLWTGNGVRREGQEEWREEE
jgi:cellulose synthase/poly-beta-1,6-N-acetylglucosamine synthase-like glycosyltransferase